MAEEGIFCALQTLQGFFAALVQSENTSFETLLDASLIQLEVQ
jgi:hypothetical protein